jgi:hypothetical protein
MRVRRSKLKIISKRRRAKSVQWRWENHDATQLATFRKGSLAMLGMN